MEKNKGHHDSPAIRQRRPHETDLPYCPVCYREFHTVLAMRVHVSTLHKAAEVRQQVVA